MQYILADVIRVESPFASIGSVLKPKQSGFESDGDQKFVHRYEDGSYKYWDNTDIVNAKFVTTASLPTTLADYFTGNGTSGYIPMFSATHGLTNSPIITDGTNVGIGTLSPGANLHISNLVSGVNELLRLSVKNEYNAGGKISWFMGDNVLEANKIENIITADGTTSSHLLFSTYVTATGLTEKMRIMGNGNVGINVVDPDTKLEILNAGNQLKLSYDNNQYATFYVDINGALNISASGSGQFVRFADPVYVNCTDNPQIRLENPVSASQASFHCDTSGALKITSSGSAIILDILPVGDPHVSGQLFRFSNSQVVYQSDG